MKDNILEQHMSYRNQIYVDIDSLLDTRLGTLIQYFPEVAGSMLMNMDKYYKRFRDEFFPIPNNLFKHLYNKRNKETLKNSKLTNITQVLVEEINFIEFNPELKNLTGKPKLIINVYPYDFSNREEDLLKTIIWNILDYADYDIEVINISPLNIDSKFLSKCYSIIMYNGLDWLNYKLATKEIINGEILDTRFYVPLQLNPLTLNPDKLDESITLLNKTMRYFTDLKIIENFYFSIKKEK